MSQAAVLLSRRSGIPSVSSRAVGGVRHEPLVTGLLLPILNTKKVTDNGLSRSTGNAIANGGSYDGGLGADIPLHAA